MKILGIDYGKKKVGLAVSHGLFPSSIGVIAANELAARLPTIIETHEIERIVIGLPEGKMKNQVVTIGKQLSAQLGIEVILWDETLTSQQARRALLLNSKQRKKRKLQEHAVAAALLLESYLAGTT